MTANDQSTPETPDVAEDVQHDEPDHSVGADGGEVAPDVEPDASFDEPDDGMSFTADSLQGLSYSEKFPVSAYPSDIGDVSVDKLRSSIVAPLVAQARGYRTLRQGDDDVAETMRRYQIDGRTSTGRHLKQLSKAMSWMEIPYFRMDSIAREADHPILATMQLRPEHDPEDGDLQFGKYMFLKDSPTAIDAHPATPPSWFADKDIPVMFTEGVVKADSALTALLRDAGVKDADLRTWTGSGSRTALRRLLEGVPADKRVLILAIPGVSSWKQNDEWSTISLRGRDAWICFDGDVARNANVWDAARALVDFLEKRHAERVLLVDLSGRGEAIENPKRGIDDFFEASGVWADILPLLTDELPDRPIDDTGEKGDTRVSSDGRSVEQCFTRPDPSGVGEISYWKVIDHIGGYIRSFEEFRSPTGPEDEKGRIGAGGISRSERQVVIDVEWVNPLGVVESAEIRGPKGILDSDPALWETKLKATIPTSVSALPTWPPKTGLNWVRAIKAYRSAEIVDDVLWSCQGWVPTKDGNPVFIAGRQVIGRDGEIRNESESPARAGLTADDFPNIDDFGVIDEDMSLAEQRDLLRSIVDAYTSPETFVDFRFGMVALLAGIRPIVPITPHSILYVVGGRRSGKSWVASKAMQFWQSRPGAWTNERLPGAASDTPAWMENSIAKSMFWVIDDFAPNSNRQKWERQTSDLEQIVRASFNRSGRGRMTPDMKTRVTLPPRAFVVVTAENELQIDSVRDRMLTLYSDREGGFISNKGTGDPLAVLDHLGSTGAQARLSAQLLRWVSGTFVTQGYPSVRSMFVDSGIDATSYMIDYIRRATGPETNAKRHAGIASEYALSIKLLSLYAASIGMDEDFLDLIEGMYEKLAMVTVDLSRAQSKSTPGRALLEALRHVMETQNGYVESIDPDQVGKPPAEDANTLLRLGWTMGRDPRGTPLGRFVPNAKNSGEDIVLFSQGAFDAAGRYARHLIPSGQTERTSWTAVWNEHLASTLWNRKRSNTSKEVLNTVSVSHNYHRAQGVPIAMTTLYPELGDDDTDDGVTE